MKRKTKIILITIFLLLLLTTSLLVTTFILSSNYKYACVRNDVVLIQHYDYEFNFFGYIKKFNYQTEVLFDSIESANSYYEELIVSNEIDKDRIKLEKGSVIFDNTYPEQKLANNIIKIKRIHSNLDYKCKLVRK